MMTSLLERAVRCPEIPVRVAVLISLAKRTFPIYNSRMLSSQLETVVILDFETSGISPCHGARVIEVGAVKLRDGVIIDRFQSLMNPGLRIDRFIENYTGITNLMLQGAPQVADVMREFSRFIGSLPLVAHNAAFDRRFLEAELARIGRQHTQGFGCSMLAARRIFPDAPNHKLETLVRYRNLRTGGVFHRGLADAEMTAQLWLAMSDELRRVYGFHDVPFALIHRLTQLPRASVPGYLLQMVNS
jgi:DNA polymerase-3 subunit epsilon